MDLLALALGLLAGLLLGWFAAASRRSAELTRLTAALAAHEAHVQATGSGQASQAAMADTFRALSAEALRDSTEQLLALAETRLRTAGAEADADLAERQHAVAGLVQPVQDALARMDQQVAAARSAQEQSVAALQRELELTRTAAASLATAMRRPTVRGQWGEMQLRRAVEVAGMAEHCDFTEQVTVAAADRTQRPDLIVHLAGDRHVVVDAKVPLDAFLAGCEAADPATAERHLAAHARQVRSHVDALGSRAYWEQLVDSPEFVVMFVPSDAILVPALESDPSLYEYAAAKRVLLVTPTTLVALLRTVDFSWRQQRLAESAQAVTEAGRELYRRLSTLGNHLNRLGRSLNASVTSFNKTVGSLERQVLPSARRMSDLGISGTPLPSVPLVETAARALTQPELVTDTPADVVALTDRQALTLTEHAGVPRRRAGPA